MKPASGPAPEGWVISDNPADGSPLVMPSGIVLKPEDFSEIYVLVKTGTPVTIN